MLAYFPVPYKDELLYSCIARYAVHTGQINNQKAVVRDVFTKGMAVAVPDLPSHLNNFIHNLRLVWPTSTDELILNYTLAPIYFPFLSNLQANKICGSMVSEKGGDIHTRAGIAASSVKSPKFFRYCPECANEEEAKFGENYWSRAHQLAGVEICIRHNCLLEDATVHFHPREKHHFHPAATECIVRKGNTVAISSHECRLIKMYTELLTEPNLIGLGPERWTSFYKKLAKELGFVCKNRVQHREIYRCLKQIWNGSSFAKHLAGSSENHWLVNIFRKHRKSFHPLRHLIVLSAFTPDRQMSEILLCVKKLSTQPATSPTPPIQSTASKEQAYEHRIAWTSILSNYPKLGIKALRDLSEGGRLYTWLYRNDYHWLMSHRPLNKVRKNNHYQVDYLAWDRKCVEALENTYLKFQGLVKRPRLSRTRLIKKLPRANSIEKHLGDLRLTKKWLGLHAETVEHYRLFRLRSAYRTIVERNQEVKRWRLLRTANIRKEFLTSQIEQEIQKLVFKGK